MYGTGLANERYHDEYMVLRVDSENNVFLQEFTTFFGELQEPKRLVAFTKFATVGHMEPGERQGFVLSLTPLCIVWESLTLKPVKMNIVLMNQMKTHTPFHSLYCKNYIGA